jgi:hypothetical protein
LRSGDLAALRLDPLDSLLSLIVHHALLLEVLDLGLVSEARMYIVTSPAGVRIRVEVSLNLPLRSIRNVLQQKRVWILGMIPHRQWRLTYPAMRTILLEFLVQLCAKRLCLFPASLGVYAVQKVVLVEALKESVAGSVALLSCRSCR